MQIATSNVSSATVYVIQMVLMNAMETCEVCVFIEPKIYPLHSCMSAHIWCLHVCRSDFGITVNIIIWIELYNNNLSHRDRTPPYMESRDPYLWAHVFWNSRKHGSQFRMFFSCKKQMLFETNKTKCRNVCLLTINCTHVSTLVPGFAIL